MSTFSSIQRLKEEAAERTRRADDAVRARNAEKERQAAAARRVREEQEKKDLERERKLKIAKAGQEKLAKSQLDKQQAERPHGGDEDSDEADSKARAAAVAKFMDDKKDKKNGKLDKLRSQTAKQSISRDLARAKQKAKVMGHKEDLLTRDEKRKAKLQKQIGGSAKLGIGRKVAATSSSSASTPAQRRSDASASETIALGAHRKDNRTVDEIQRELRAKKGKDSSVYQKLAAREKERSDALDRRKRAMASKGKGARREDSDDHVSATESDSSDGMVLRKGAQHAEETRKSNSFPEKRGAAASSSSSTARKVNPADFLPGAPLRPEVAEAAKQREKELKKLRKDEGATGSKRSAAREAARETKRQKKETPRERFLRQEREKKAANGKGKAKSATVDETDSDEEEEEDDEDDVDEDDGASDESSSDDANYKARNKSKKKAGKDKGSGYRSQIWEIMRAGRGNAKPVEISDSDVDDDDDMEADLDEVYREEMRSAKIARKEDEKELLLEQKHAEEKAKRKRASTKK